MMPMRNLARSAPRALSRLASPSIRAPSAMTTRVALRLSSSSSVPWTQPLSSLCLGKGIGRSMAFSTTTFRQAAAPQAPAAGETDDELVAKIESEIQYETEVEDADMVPTSVKDFLENGPFEVVDVPGKEEVKLVREFGGEKITITFSIADLANYEPDPFLEDSDPALGDEDLEDPDTVSSPAHRSQQAAASGQRSKSSQKDEDDLGLDEESEDDGEHLSSHGAQPVPVRLTIVVEKPAAPEAGALVVDAVAQDGAILVEGLHRYANAAEAHGIAPRSADSDLSPYPGPPFGSLDEDLQMLVERYLEERGISQALAVFVPDYVDMKEQREYVSWLGGVKSFLEA